NGEHVGRSDAQSGRDETGMQAICGDPVPCSALSTRSRWRRRIGSPVAPCCDLAAAFQSSAFALLSGLRRCNYKRLKGETMLLFLWAAVPNRSQPRPNATFKTRLLCSAQRRAPDSVPIHFNRTETN